MLLMPLAVAECFIWATRRKSRIDLAALALATVIAVSIYSPGTLWFMCISMFFVKKQFFAFISQISAITRILSIIIILAVLAPLVRSIVLDWTIIKSLLLIPTSFTSIYGILKAFVWSGLAFVWHTRTHLAMSIGRWPMLNAVQSVLLIFGVFAMMTQALAVGYMLVIFIGFCLLMAAINHNSSLVIIALPILSMFIAAGLRYLYIEWKTIFPRNPLPRMLAVSLMVMLVAMQVFFSIRYTLVAWPHTPETQHLYVLK